MPNINITDSRKRDAVVKAENTSITEEVRYVDSEGSVASTRKVLKATVAHDYETLNKQFGDDPQKLGFALIEGDPEVDMERCGVYLWGVSKVYVTSDDGIVYRIEQIEKVLDTEGQVKETRPRRRAEPNVDAEIPLTWTGRKLKKTDAIRRFVFSSKLQVVHVNGLTYDFLYGMAKELDAEKNLMVVGGGSSGKDPLVFRRGSIPYRGFLEGRIDGDQYVLLLHLSNMELRVPDSASREISEKKNAEKGVEADKAVSKNSAKKAAMSDDVNKKDTESAAVTKKSAAKNKSVAARQTPPASAQSAGETKELASAQTVDPQHVDNDDLGVWLKSIRMGKYLDLFVENEIDVDVLSELSDEDLKELEIPLGSRRRLLKAVAEADNLRAEVAMAVMKIQRSSGDKKSAGDKKTKNKKTKSKKG